MRNTVFGILFALLLFSGCITSEEYKIEQQFMEDGTSLLEIEEKTTMNEDFINTYKQFVEGIEDDARYVALVLLYDYLNSEDLIEDTCSFMEGVDSCTGEAPGLVMVTATAEPGEFYEYERGMDWFNLKEVLTYKIEKVPLQSYYLYKERDAESAMDKMLENMKNYLEKTADDYLTKDGYCQMGVSGLRCTFSSFEDERAIVKLSGNPYGQAVNIKWIGCSYEPYSEMLFISNSSEAEAMVAEPVEVNEVLDENGELLVPVACPSGSKSLVVFYERVTYSGVEEEITAFEILDKEEMKVRMLEETDEQFEGLYGTYELTDESLMFLDFSEGRMGGTDFGALAELQDLANIKIEYTAKFPYPIAGAEVDGEGIETGGGELVLTLDDLRDLPDGYLNVRVEKELSPLGAATWIVPVAVIVAVYLLFAKGKGKAVPKAKKKKKSK